MLFLSLLASFLCGVLISTMGIIFIFAIGFDGMKKDKRIAIIMHDKKKGRLSIYGDLVSLVNHALAIERHERPGSVKYID